ncbi:hypothetical protein NSE_0143 [Neorickettsia sennetsu str. Miyayama]|uniref:Uncharacterized protein n=1 Tax=Ehrlichia sennetsu (strain ATCC VR-367 / Miyayama) TaxID=222891 RepID=Q2GEQ4_EHRS3|nr:hypothetical protein NSE_0143 [Neorickettsia sennetsu str. Miyayama]
MFHPKTKIFKAGSTSYSTSLFGFAIIIVSERKYPNCNCTTNWNSPGNLFSK